MGTKKASKTDIVSTPVSGVQRHGVASDEEPFEVLIERLEGLVGKLEDGDLSLEASLKAYEDGIRAVREAQGRLDAMDARLEQLTRDGRVVALETKAPASDPALLKQPPPAEPTEFDDTDF